MMFDQLPWIQRVFMTKPFPKLRAVLSIGKKFLFKANWGSFQSYTIKVSQTGCFTRLWNPSLLCRLCPLLCWAVNWCFIQEHSAVLCLDFELSNNFIFMWKNTLPSFIYIITIFTNGKVMHMPAEMNVGVATAESAAMHATSCTFLWTWKSQSTMLKFSDTFLQLTTFFPSAALCIHSGKLFRSKVQRATCRISFIADLV